METLDLASDQLGEERGAPLPRSPMEIGDQAGSLDDEMGEKENLCLAHEDNLGASTRRKRDRKGKGCNLRKSLAWNHAFFTEEGVLGPMELSLLSRSSSKSKLSGHLMPVSEMSPLTVYNRSSVRPPLHDIATNSQSKDSKPRKLFPSINEEPEAHGVTSRKTPLGKGIFRNIPRSPATHTQKRVANASTTNPTSKPPKFMPSKSHAPFPTTSRNVELATKSSKPYQSAANGYSLSKIDLLFQVNVGKNASAKLPNVKMDLACSSSSSNSSAANRGKNIVENRSGPSKAIANCSSSTKLHETVSCAPGKVAPSLPQRINYVPGGPPAPVHARPSALRMPSPSLGFFCQGKVSPSYNSQHHTQLSESKIPSLTKTLNLRQNIQLRPQTTSVGQQSTKGTVAAKSNASVISRSSQACLAASCLKPPSTRDTSLHMETDTVMNQGDIVDRRASVSSGGSYGQKDSQEQSGSGRSVVGPDIHEQPGVLPLRKPDSDRVKELEYSDSSSKVSNGFFVQGIIQFPKVNVPDNDSDDRPPAKGSDIDFSCSNKSQVRSEEKLQECYPKVIHGDLGVHKPTRHSHDEVARDGTYPAAIENNQPAGNSDFALNYPIPTENKSAGDSDFPSDLESGFIARSNSFDASTEVNLSRSKETPSTCFKKSLESDHSLSLNSAACGQVTTPGSGRMTSGQSNTLSEKYEPVHLEDREIQDCCSNCATSNAISSRKQDSLMPRNIVGADTPSREVMLNAVPFSDEWVAVLEAFGEDILEKKTGPVQHSPPDKAEPEPGPWSPALLGMSSSYSSQQSSSSQRYIDKRLKTVVEARPPPVEVPTCNCGVRLQKKTSYTGRNPCHRFGSCVNNACNHKVWTWLDKQEVPAYVNDCLNIVMDNYGELANEVETVKRKSEVDSSSSSQQRHQRCCDECAVLRVRCQDLETQLVERKKPIQENNFLAGIVIALLLSILLVLISK